MLTGCPSEVCGYGDASETVFFDCERGFLAGSVFEESAEPGVGVARDVNGCCGYEVVPDNFSLINSSREVWGREGYHDVNV